MKPSLMRMMIRSEAIFCVKEDCDTAAHRLASGGRTPESDKFAAGYHRKSGRISLQASLKTVYVPLTRGGRGNYWVRTMKDTNLLAICCRNPLTESNLGLANMCVYHV